MGISSPSQRFVGKNSLSGIYISPGDINGIVVRNNLLGILELVELRSVIHLNTLHGNSDREKETLATSRERGLQNVK